MSRIQNILDKADREGVIRGVFHHEFSAQKHLKDVRAVLDTLK